MSDCKECNGTGQVYMLPQLSDHLIDCPECKLERLAKELDQKDLLDLICLWIHENKHTRTPHMRRIPKEILLAKDIARDLLFDRFDDGTQICPVCDNYM